MAIQFQMRRGTDVEHTTFTGAPGEVTVDTINNTLVIHDGTTTGGFPLARQSNIPTNVSQLNNDAGFITSGNISETTTTLTFVSDVLTYTNEDGNVVNIDLTHFLNSPDTNLPRIVSGSLNGTTGTLTLTRDDASALTVDLSALKNDSLVLAGGGATSVSGTYPNFTITSTDTNTTYDDATTGVAGLMSTADKTKLNGIATGANNYVHPTNSGNKHIPVGGSVGQILGWSSDGSAQWISASAGGANAIDDLTDVNTTGKTTGDHFVYNGVRWEAQPITIPTNVSDLANDSGFISSYTETDPIYSAWDKSTGISITESQISDFGNYLTSETVTSLSLTTNILSYTNELGATTTIDLSLYLDDTNLARLVNGTVNGTTGIATFTRDDASTFTVDFSALLDDVIVSVTGSGATSVTGTYPNFTISSTDTTYTDATTTVAGLMSTTDKTKLDGIESGATADQTAVEIKTAYESNTDTNAYTDAEKIKLDSIESGATADQTAVEIKTAYELNTDTNAYTDAEKSKLGTLQNAFVSIQTEDQNATDGQTVISLAVASYSPGNNEMELFLNGVRVPSAEFTETDSTTITLNWSLTSADQITVKVTKLFTSTNVTTVSSAAPTGGSDGDVWYQL